MTSASKSENLADDTRQRIIAAALHLFGQIGYSQATTRAIAHAAGVNEITLFRHFGSKNNLLMACMQAFNATSFASSFTSELSGDYANDLLCMAERQMDDTRAKLDVLRVLLCDARSVPELNEAIISGAQSNLTRLSDYFARQIQAGIIRDELDPQVLAFTFDSLFSTSLIVESMFQQPLAHCLSPEALIQPLVDLFVRATRSELTERI